MIQAYSYLYIYTFSLQIYRLNLAQVAQSIVSWTTSTAHQVLFTLTQSRTVKLFFYELALLRWHDMRSIQFLVTCGIFKKNFSYQLHDDMVPLKKIVRLFETSDPSSKKPTPQTIFPLKIYNDKFIIITSSI